MNARCDDGPCQDMNNYYDSVLFKMIYVPKFSDIRMAFIDSIIANIKSFFPNLDLKLFKIFTPIEVPNQIGDALTYGGN